MKDNLGRFVRTIKEWSPDNWDNGYTDSRGRFRVYRPDCPRAYKDGYALRAHVVWWLETGKVHPIGTELHHIDLTKNNDKIENLALLTKSEHRKVHQENWINIVCVNCGKEFKEHAWRVSQRDVKFCSQKCFIEFPKTSKKVIRKCIECKGDFTVIPSSKKILCSHKCSANYTWRIRHASFV